MLRALAWKEYREQRQVALIGLFAAAMLPVLYLAIGYAINRPGFRLDSSDLLGMTFYIAAVIVWPIFAAVAGAATNPREARVGSLGFLLSRPVSRGRVWGVKVGLGFVTLATVIAGSILIFWALLRLAWGPAIPLMRGFIDLADTAWLAGHLVLAFACSVFYATLMANSLVAAGAGLVTSLGIHAFFLGFWALVGLRMDFEWASASAIFVVALLVFAGGVYTYTRGELLRGRRLRRLALIEVVSALAVLFALSSGIAFALTRVNLSNAIFINPELSPRGDFIAVSANRENMSSEQIWLIDISGSARQLAGRGSQTMAFSPDGEWIAYSRFSLFFGYPPMRFDLRMARVDGSEDRRLGKSYGGFPVFSPDGTRVTTAFGRKLSIAYLDRSEVRDIQLPVGLDSQVSSPVVWSPDGEELLLALRPATAAATLALYDLRSQDLRIFDPPDEWPVHFSYPMAADRPVPSRMPISGYWLVPSDDPDPGRRYRREYGIGLISSETLKAEILALGTCPTVAIDLSADERFLIYSTCDEWVLTESQRTPRGAVIHMRNLDSSAVVHMRNLDTGEDRALATLRGSIDSMKFSPSGGSIVVGTRAGPLTIQVDEGDLPTVSDWREEEPGPRGGWMPIGWLSDSQLMLARQPSESRGGRYRFRPAVLSPSLQIEIGSLAVLDIETGEERTVFSR